MAVTRPGDLTVAKNDVAAEVVAATIWELAHAAPADGPTRESALRLLKRVATELVELHGLRADEVIPKVTHPAPDNHGFGEG
jgi:hypothetical protein